MVADLLAAGEQREHQAAAGVLVGALDALHGVAHERLVEHDLLAGQRQRVVGLGLGRQLRGDARVGLATAQQERPDQVREALRDLRVDARLDGCGPHPAEGLAAPEQAGDGPVEDRPELGEVVLDRGAGQGHARAGSDGAQAAGGGGAGVLDVLGLVGDDQPPGHLAELAGAVLGGGVDAHRAVGGEHEAGVAVGRARVEQRRLEQRGFSGVGASTDTGEPGQRAGAAVEAAYGDPGSEPPDLGLPVAEQAGRADHQRRRGRLPVGAGSLGAVQVQRDQGERLAQPHVVGQAGAQPETGELGEPGEAVALVVAQRGLQRRRRLDGLAGRSGAQLLADLQQRGPDDHLGGLVLPQRRDAAERSGDGLGRLDVAHQPLAGLARDGRVDHAPGAAQLDHRRGGGGEGVHLLGRQRVAVEGDLPLEGEDRVGGQQTGLQRRLTGATAARLGVEHRGGRQVAPQAARPQHVDTALGQRRHAVLQQAGDLLGLQADLVGHPQRQQPVEHRPRLGRRPQRDGRVGAGAVTEPVVLGVVEPQRGGVGHVQGVALVVDLQHQPHRARDQLLLVGLHAQRDRDEVREVAAAADLGDAALQPLLEGVVRRAVDRRCSLARPPGLPQGSPARRGSRPGDRRAPGYGVGDRVQHRPHHLLGVRCVLGTRRARAGQHPHAVLVLVAELTDPPRRRPPRLLGRGLEGPGSHQSHPQQRRPAEQRHARVEVLAGVGLGQHRDRRAHRERDGAPVVDELHHRVARRHRGTEGGRACHRDEPHRAHPLARRSRLDATTVARRTDTASARSLPPRSRRSAGPGPRSPAERRAPAYVGADRDPGGRRSADGEAAGQSAVRSWRTTRRRSVGEAWSA